MKAKNEIIDFSKMSLEEYLKTTRGLNQEGLYYYTMEVVASFYKSEDERKKEVKNVVIKVSADTDDAMKKVFELKNKIKEAADELDSFKKRYDELKEVVKRFCPEQSIKAYIVDKDLSGDANCFRFNTG
jgi:hypothetical protein